MANWITASDSNLHKYHARSLLFWLHPLQRDTMKSIPWYYEKPMNIKCSICNGQWFLNSQGVWELLLSLCRGRGRAAMWLPWLCHRRDFYTYCRGGCTFFLSTIILANVPAFTIILPLKGTKTWPPCLGCCHVPVRVSLVNHVALHIEIIVTMWGKPQTLMCHFSSSWTSFVRKYFLN